MKTLKALILCTILPFVGKVEVASAPSQTPKFTNFVGFGNLEEAYRDYFVPNAHMLNVTMGGSRVESGEFISATPERDTYQVGLYYTFNGVTTRLNTSKEAIEKIMREKLILLAKGALTNVLLDKNKPLQVWAFTQKPHPIFYSIKGFMLLADFNFIRLPNGDYSIPDFSQTMLGLADGMVFDIPGLESAVVRGWRGSLSTQTPGSADGILFNSDEDEMGWFVRGIGLSLPTPLVVGGNISHISMKVNQELMEFGPDGKRVTVSPLKISRVTENFLEINGPSGLTVTVERAELVNGPWTDTQTLITLPTYPVYYEVIDPTGFFRLRVVNY